MVGVSILVKELTVNHVKRRYGKQYKSLRNYMAQIVLVIPVTITKSTVKWVNSNSNGIS